MSKVLVCCFSPHIYNDFSLGFAEAGCETRNLFITQEIYGSKSKLLKCHLEKAIERFKPNYIFAYGWWQMGVNIQDYLEVIRRKGIPHIWWAYDDPLCFYQSSLPIAKRSDFVFSTVEECIPWYRDNGVEAHLLPHGCSPRYTAKVKSDPGLAHDLALVANNYNIKVGGSSGNPFRLKGIENVLMPLVNNVYDVMVWGRWWVQSNSACILPERFYGGVLPVNDVPAAYSSCKIALGLQQVDNSKTHLSVRSYEVMGMGVFHISQYSQALEYNFTKGVHMEWSRSPEETLELVEYYLGNEAAREKVALRGQQEIHKRHMLLHRARMVLERIGG